MTNWNTALTNTNLSRPSLKVNARRYTLLFMLCVFYALLFTIASIIGESWKCSHLPLEETPSTNLATFEHGARIIPSFTSPPKSSPSRYFSSSKTFYHSPAIVLSGPIVHRRCWLIHGYATLGVKLSHAAVVHTVGIEHSKEDTSRVPKHFRIWAKMDGNETSLFSSHATNQIPPSILNHSSIFMGSFAYQFDQQSPAQNFTINAQKAKVEELVIEIYNDVGNSNTTCLYKVQIYGEIPLPYMKPV
jgi:hypothetical protein